MMDCVSKLQTTSLVFQKDDLLVCSINCIVDSCIDVFKVMKTQPSKNYKSLLDNIKEEDGDAMHKANSTNHLVDIEVLMTNTQLNITKKSTIKSLSKSSVVPKRIYMTVSVISTLHHCVG